MGFKYVLYPSSILTRIIYKSFIVSKFNVTYLSNFSNSICISYASDNTTMKFGDLVSTSNTYDNSEVTVNTDTTVIWTMGIEPFMEAINNEAITPSIDNK